MEKRIELEKRGRKPSEIKDLNLDNSRSSSIVGLTDEFVNLETLSLINVGLTSLKGFPKLPNLKKLELSDNRISNGLDSLKGSPKLTHLNLSGNRLKDFESLEPLNEFKTLKNLDLFNNDVTNIPKYKEKIFNLIPNLKYLDGFDAKGQEAEDSEVDEDDNAVNGEDDSVDGEDEVDEDEDEADSGEEGEEEDDDEDEDDVGLAAVYDSNIAEDDSEDEDYDEAAGDVEEDDDDEGSDAHEASSAKVGSRGEKRKRGNEESGEEEEDEEDEKS